MKSWLVSIGQIPKRYEFRNIIKYLLVAHLELGRGLAGYVLARNVLIQMWRGRGVLLLRIRIIAKARMWLRNLLWALEVRQGCIHLLMLCASHEESLWLWSKVSIDCSKGLSRHVIEVDFRGWNIDAWARAVRQRWVHWRGVDHLRMRNSLSRGVRAYHLIWSGAWLWACGWHSRRMNHRVWPPFMRDRGHLLIV